MTPRLCSALVLFALVTSASAQTVQKQDVEGIRNFSRVDATIGCGGTTAPSAFPALKQMGFASIVNLREASEAGADIDAARAAATAAGLKYIHLPFNGSKPDTAPIDQFIAAVSAKENQPVYIHCGSANRVGALWYVKRVLSDGWTPERAMAEAEAIGLSSAALKEYVQGYAASHRTR